ncbi:MAG TPA: FecR domain-containing protein [Segetibacter sp.]|jgi:ferric-dicitrate binding protein FerR (iron transport regulator)
MENLVRKLKELIDKDEWTPEDMRWLLNYFSNTDGQDLRFLLKQEFENHQRNGEHKDLALPESILENLHQKIEADKKLAKAAVLKMWFLRTSVACAIAFICLSIFLVFKTTPQQKLAKKLMQDKPAKLAATPGNNKVLLTLADGTTIVLDDKKNGFLTSQGNTKVIKLDGKLIYNSSSANSGRISYNTITTPAGGQYQLELPDGTFVWLNARSSLSFPTAFTGKQRRVKMEGEAYFEVARNISMPFAVEVNDAEVQVLGTRFNVMAYHDEGALKTTLLKGEIKFVYGSDHRILKPGQQTQLTRAGKVKVLSGVDLDEVTAWKNGLFDFEGADLVTVARHLSRWYDVELIFDRKNDELFYAKIPRETKLTDALKALELTGKVRFTIEGRKITVRSTD